MSETSKWRTGREDMQSYDGETGEPFASIYEDDPDGEMHMGHRLPFTVARVFGPECKERARLMAASRELLAACEAVVWWQERTGGMDDRLDQRDVYQPLLAAIAAAMSGVTRERREGQER